MGKPKKEITIKSQINGNELVARLWSDGWILAIRDNGKYINIPMTDEGVNALINVLKNK
jgi:hypothetical protein